MVKNRAFNKLCAVSVENVVEPLVTQISMLISQENSVGRPNGLSHSKVTILDQLQNALGDLIRNAENIATEFPDGADNFKVALSDVKDISEHFHRLVSNFLDNPLNEESRGELLSCSRSLLSSVTRILILADLLDVNQLRNCLENIKGDAECIGILTEESEISRLCSLLEHHLEDLHILMNYRSQAYFSLGRRNDLNNVCLILTLACKMIEVSTKAAFRHPESATLAANRAFAVQLTEDAVDWLGCGCDATCIPSMPPPLQGQAVARLMQEIVKSAEAGVEKVESWNAILFQNNLQKLSLEIKVLTQSAGLPDCFQMDIARDLEELSEAANQFVEVLNYETTDGLRSCLMKIERICERIRSVISQAALIHCASVFITNDCVLGRMEESAKFSDEGKLVSAVSDFQQQTSDLLDCVLCLCGVEMDATTTPFARFTTNIMEQLAPQLINASKALAVHNQSSVTKENFTVFLEAYKMLMQKLCDSIDEMTSISDFLQTHDRLLLKDLRTCQTKARTLQTSGLINVSHELSARCSRAIKYVLTKLEDSVDHRVNADKIQTTLRSIKERLIPRFTEATREACRTLRSQNGSADIASVRDAGESIRDAFIELRSLFGRGLPQDEDMSPDSAEPSLNFPPPTPSLLPPLPPSPEPVDMRTSGSDGAPSTQNSQSSLPPQPILSGTASVLNQLVDKFNMERVNLVRQIERMDEWDNGVMLSLVRKICLRLSHTITYMTAPDGGVIASDGELVQTTRGIALMAAQLNGNCEEFARDSSKVGARDNLIADLKNISLFSHELAVMSRVKADLKTASAELRLDNAVSLVQSACNLILAIVQTISKIRAIPQQSRLPLRAPLPTIPSRPRSASELDDSDGEGIPFTFGVKIDQIVNFSYKFS